MGQYYKPAVLNNEQNPIAWLHSHKYDNGLKLMEHSWLGNSFVSTVERLLVAGGAWHMQPIVWAGDYADGEERLKRFEVTGEVNEKGESIMKEIEPNIYDLCEDSNEIKPAREKSTMAKYRYIVNHTKKQFVDKKAVPVEDIYQYTDKKGKPRKNTYRIHPLPLLTCEGNGGGGGDFFGKDPKGLIGSWARDIISIETSKPVGYEELKFDLTEKDVNIKQIALSI